MCAVFYPGAKVMFLISCIDVKTLFERAHELANLANRSGPIATDLLLACKERNVDVDQLRMVSPGPRGKKRESSGARLLPIMLTTQLIIPLDPHQIQAATLVLPEPTPPLPRMINTDEDEPGLVIPATLRSIPHYTPTLPPKHTYLRTPVRTI
jgi:transcription initiation factor TFIID subunit 8